jgi:YegS/Rv2252/BmrU family lipid kinase
MFEWIPVIINPAAGQKAAVLSELNQVFRPAGVRWSVEITQREDDAYHLAQKFAEDGAEIVAVYGGDGTVSEAATALAGKPTALAILPGGTGNVLAQEFNIPRDFIQAAKLLTDKYSIRTVDLGQVDERTFLLRAGVGLESLVIAKAPRKLKDRFGLLAYGIAGLQALAKTRPMNYLLNLDGESVEAKGLLCTVANAAHLGLPGLNLSPIVDISDGYLDVIVLRKIDIELLIALLNKTVSTWEGLGKLQHWRIRRVTIDVHPPQTVQVDGDNLGKTPINVVCIPGTLKVVVPI